MGTYGDLWGGLGSFGDLWGPMGSYGHLWGTIVAYGDQWAPMGTFGDLWGRMGTYGDLWGSMGTYGDPWILWGPMGTFGHLWGTMGSHIGTLGGAIAKGSQAPKSPTDPPPLPDWSEGVGSPVKICGTQSRCHGPSAEMGAEICSGPFGVGLVSS